MMMNGFTINQRIEPNWDVVTFPTQRGHSEVIADLLKLEFGERIERKRSTWRKSRGTVTADQKQVTKDRLSRAENNIDGYALIKHYFRYVSHVLPAAERLS
jgi:hypothetical protein